MAGKRTSNFRNRSSVTGGISGNPQDSSNLIVLQAQQRQRSRRSNKQKLLWLMALLVLVLSIIVGFARDRFLTHQQKQQTTVQRNNNAHDDATDLNDATKNEANQTARGAQRPNRATRIWRGAKNGLIKGLRSASPLTSTTGQFFAAATDKEAVAIIAPDSTTTTIATKRHSKGPDLSAEYPSAFSIEPHLTDEQRILMQRMSVTVHEHIQDLYPRAAAVAWGGVDHGTPWWNPAIKNPHHLKHPALEQLDGGFLLYSYLSIMKWPTDLMTKFPFRLCKETCSSFAAIEHSLEWRKKFQPWLVTPSMLSENADGWVYVRGFSPFSAQDPHYGRHAIIFIRPGMHHVNDPQIYFRCILNAVEQAVASALLDSGGRVGKFNVVVDGANFEWSQVPSIKYIKQAVVMLQDHFPNRLGTVSMAHISMTGEILFKLVKPLLTKEVRDKIKIVSSDPVLRMEQLETLIEREYIPDWLDGPDDHKFDVEVYYPEHRRGSEQEGRNFLETMPYHAL